MAAVESLDPSNQLHFSSRFQVQRLRQDLTHAQKQIQEYENFIAYLDINICVNCKALFEKYATSAGLTTPSTPGAVITSPSSKPKFSLPRLSDSSRSSAPSNRMHFWQRVFKGRRPTESVSPDTAGRSGMSQLCNDKAPDITQPNVSVSVSSESIHPSLSVTRHTIPLPETSTLPNQLDWSVDFGNSNIQPALNVKVEHVLMFEGTVYCVKFSPDGTYLAVGVDNGRTYIYDVKTGAKSCFLRLADNSETLTRTLGIWGLCFSPDRKYLAVGASNGQLRIWEIAKKHTRNIFQENINIASDPDFSPDGRSLVSCSYNGVRIWRMRDGRSKVLKDKSGSHFECVKFNSDGKYIAAGTDDGMLIIWNVRTSQLVAKRTVHGSTLRSVVFTLDGKGLVSGGRDDMWEYWDISLSELSEPGYGTTKDSMVGQESKVTAHTNSVSSIAISPDSQWVVSGSTDDTVRIWDLRNGALQCTLKGHKYYVWSVDFCRTGNYLASGSEDGQVALWRYEAG